MSTVLPVRPVPPMYSTLVDSVDCRSDMGTSTKIGNIDLVRRFLKNKSDPQFEEELVRRAVRSLPPIDGLSVLDVGCGPGLHALAMEERGAQVTAVELSPDALHQRGLAPKRSIIGDGTTLPIPTATFDGALCSNMLEHTPNPLAVVDELERVVRPGGWAWVSWTTWYSPWGGHAIAPFHYFGPLRGEQVYRKLFGDPKGTNLPYDGVWPLHITQVLDHLATRPNWRVQAVEPRYYPRLRVIMRFKGMREVLAWNCLIRLERI